MVEAPAARGGARGGIDHASIDPSAVLGIVEWLTGDEFHEVDDAGLIAGLGRRLRYAGLPLDRLTLYLRTLHPEILGRAVAWAPNEPVEVHDREHGIELSAAFTDSPLRRVMETREPLMVRAGDPAWTEVGAFRGHPLAEIVIVPLCNADGPVSAASFGTTDARGFSPAVRAALDRVLPALRNTCELRTLRKVELPLLDSHIGASTASLILAGRIRRGQVESLEAALMLCGLRSFTELSNRMPAGRVVELMNAYLDRVIPAIADAGGEVLKLIGDAVMAFFHREDAAAACAAALDGARKALSSLDRFVAPDPPLQPPLPSTMAR